MGRWSRITALCAVFAAPLGAQDAPQQTVEGAQRFLSVLGENKQLSFNAHYYTWPAAGLAYTIDGATAGPCTTQFTGYPLGYDERGSTGVWVMNGGAQWRPDRFEAVRARHNMPRLPLTVDWSRVTSVVIFSGSSVDDGTRQNVVISWSGGFIALNTRDDALAKRLEYAANFLKAACDRTAETGF